MSRLSTEPVAREEWLKKPQLPTPQQILQACAKLQKAGADLSKMTIVYEQENMSKFWIVSKADLKRNASMPGGEVKM